MAQEPGLSGLAHPNWAVGNRVIYLDQVDSTNDECRRQAQQGAGSGLVVIAGQQTGGRGRRGRSFQSLAGKGLYLSALLRPQASPEQVRPFTAWTAVAVCQALEALTGLSCGIKWTNDILFAGRKLCGILTELNLSPDTGRVDYLVAGIGINVSQTPADFGPELSVTATSISQHMATPPTLFQVAQALLEQLNVLYAAFPQRRENYLSAYRRLCLTTGREVRLLSPGGEKQALALAINDDFSLQIRFPDGREEAVQAGEVSVRGLMGYS